MKQLEDVDPELIDQVIRQVLATMRRPDREVAIAVHLSGSAELLEWVEMIVKVPVPSNDPDNIALSKLFTAVALGLEVGYALGFRESERERSRVK